MKSKGFTLVEILAVIAILGILITIATSSVLRYVNDSRKSATQTSFKEVEDAALSYGLKLFIPNSCAIGSIAKKEADVPNTRDCPRNTVKVSELINQNLLKDTSNVLNKDKSVVLYKQKNLKTGHTNISECNTKPEYCNYELKAFVPADVVIEK